MPKVYASDRITPVVHARAYIGPGASLRGDFGRIDTCLLHGFAGKDTVVGAESTIGHGAVRSARTMELAEALTEPEEDRRSIDLPGAVPLSELKNA